MGHAGRVPGRLEDRDECTERASEATPARAATERAGRKPNYEAVYRASLVRPAAPPVSLPSRPRHVTSRHSPRLSFFSPSLESQPIEPRAPSPMRERNGQTQRQRELTHAGARACSCTFLLVPAVGRVIDAQIYLRSPPDSGQFSRGYHHHRRRTRRRRGALNGNRMRPGRGGRRQEGSSLSGDRVPSEEWNREEEERRRGKCYCRFRRSRPRSERRGD